jgi:hypothetical protein
MVALAALAGCGEPGFRVIAVDADASGRHATPGNVPVDGIDVVAVFDFDAPEFGEAVRCLLDRVGHGVTGSRSSTREELCSDEFRAWFGEPVDDFCG